MIKFSKEAVNIVLLSAIVLFMDAIYLKTISKLFGSMIKKIQNGPMRVKWGGASFVYLLVIFQIYYFIIKENRGWFDAFLLGALTYGIFDFTCYALLDDYDLTLAVVDMIWGGTLYAVAVVLFGYAKKRMRLN